MTKRKEIATRIADGVLAGIEMFYNHSTQNAVLKHVIEILQGVEFKPKEATKKYKKARYRKNEEA